MVSSSEKIKSLHETNKKQATEIQILTEENKELKTDNSRLLKALEQFSKVDDEEYAGTAQFHTLRNFRKRL